MDGQAVHDRICRHAHSPPATGTRTGVTLHSGWRRMAKRTNAQTWMVCSTYNINRPSPVRGPMADEEPGRRQEFSCPETVEQKPPPHLVQSCQGLADHGVGGLKDRGQTQEGEDHPATGKSGGQKPP